MLVSCVQQVNQLYIYPLILFFFNILFHISHYRVLSRVLCAVQWILINYLFYTVAVNISWEAAVHGVARSQTRLSDFTFTFHFHALEKEMTTHSSVLAWRIPGTGEPGGLPSMGSHRVGHD